MHLPAWAGPLFPKVPPHCLCDHHFPAVAGVTCHALGHRLDYNLCRVCVVYEREIRGEITYAQAERWSRRLIAALRSRPAPAPEPHPNPAALDMSHKWRRRPCPECGKRRCYMTPEMEICRNCAKRRAKKEATVEPLDVSYVPV